MNIRYAFPLVANEAEYFVRLMGSFSITKRNGDLLDIPSRKLQLLLAILVYRRGEPIERRELARIIWSRHAEENALTSLRQALAKLKGLMGSDYDGFIISDRRSIKVDISHVQSDISQIFGLHEISDEDQADIFALCNGLAFEDISVDEQKAKEWLASSRCEVLHHVDKLLRERIQQLEKSGKDRALLKLAIREKDRVERIYRSEASSLSLGQLKDPAADAQPSGSASADATADSSSDQTLQKYKIYLRHKVENFWIKGVFHFGNDQRALMDLLLEPSPGLIRSPYKMDDAYSELLEQPSARERIKSSEVMKFYEDHMGKILVVGAPGSGKTTLLLRIVNELLTKAARQPNYKVPVIVSASGWSHNRSSFADWVIDELDYRYDVPTEIGRQLLEENHLAIFVDELDEVNSNYVKQLVDSINQFCKYQPTAWLSIFCQKHWYENMGERLGCLGALCIDPVDNTILAEFVRQAGAGREKHPKLVLSQQSSDEFMTSPLAVHMALSLAAEGEVNLSDTNLVRKYVNALVDNSFTETKQKENFEHYLRSLARMMTSSGRSIFYMDDFVDTSLYGKTMQFFVRLIPIVLITLLCWCIVSVMAYLETPSPQAFIIPALHSLMGILVVMMIGDAGDAKLLPRYHYSFWALRQNLAVKMTTLLYASVALFACCWAMFGFAYGMTIGGGVLFMFIVYCCLDYRSAAAPKDNFGEFNELTRRTLVNAYYGLPLGLLMGALVDYLVQGQFTLGLATLLFPTIFFFILGGHAVLQSYVARVLLRLRREVPLDFQSFISVCCEKKILCRIGGGVMFPHRSVMAYLAQDQQGTAEDNPQASALSNTQQ